MRTVALPVVGMRPNCHNHGFRLSLLYAWDGDVEWNRQDHPRRRIWSLLLRCTLGPIPSSLLQLHHNRALQLPQHTRLHGRPEDTGNRNPSNPIHLRSRMGAGRRHLRPIVELRLESAKRHYGEPVFQVSRLIHAIKSRPRSVYIWQKRKSLVGN